MPSVKAVVEHPDETLRRARTLRLEVGSKTIRTPCRALTLRDASSESRLIKHQTLHGLNEIYRTLSKTKLDEIDGDQNKALEFGRSLKSVLNSQQAKDDISLLIFSYENKNKETERPKNVLPSDKEVQSICNVVTHPLIDAIIPPRIGGLSGEAYLQFLKKFFATLPSYEKNPPIIGFIPFLASTDFDQIANFYLEKGIYSFIADFENNNPVDAYLFAGQIHRLSDYIDKEYREDAFLHALNIPSTRTRQKVDVTPAKDIITFAMGFDSYGTSHLPQKLPEKVIKQIMERRAAGGFGGSGSSRPTIALDAEDAEVFRLFNRSDYGYYRSSLANLKSTIPDEENISIKFDHLFDDEISENKIKKLRRIFNVERQATEANDLKLQIASNSIMKHIGSKKFARDSVRILNKVNNQSYL